MTERLAALATIPERLRILPKVLASLRPQVDALFVYLNGFHHDVMREALTVLQRYDCACGSSLDTGDRGDGGKFAPFLAGPRKGLTGAVGWFRPPLFEAGAWCLTCDDDFIYQPGYVEHLVAASERLQAPVSLHGVVLSEALRRGEPVPWLKHGRAQWLRACDEVAEDTPVHIMGTGVGCFHSSMVELHEADFEAPHSADIWFSRACKAQGVDRYVCSHPAGLAETAAPPMQKGPRRLRHDGTYSERVAAAAPWEAL